MSFKQNVGVASRYRLTAVKPDGTQRSLTGWFKNIVTSNGLDCYLDDATQFAPFSCRVGTGNSTPSLSDTNLQLPVGGATGSWNGSATTFGRFNSTVPPYWKANRATFRFPAGVAHGRNLSEVGMIIGGVFFSRALIRDAAGNPSSVSLLVDEFLDVEWELFEIFPPSSGTFFQFIDGVETEFSYTCTPWRIGALNYMWGTVSGTIDGSFMPGSLSAMLGTNQSRAFQAGSAPPAVGASNHSAGAIGSATDASAPNGPYVSGTHRRVYRLTFGLNSANNPNGIGGVTVDGGFRAPQWYIALSPPVMKTGTKVYYIDFEVSVANSEIPAGA